MVYKGHSKKSAAEIQCMLSLHLRPGPSASKLKRTTVILLTTKFVITLHLSRTQFFSESRGTVFLKRFQTKVFFSFALSQNSASNLYIIFPVYQPLRITIIMHYLLLAKPFFSFDNTH